MFLIYFEGVISSDLHQLSCTMFVQFVYKNVKQNQESTEGYSKSIVRKNNDKFGKKIGRNN